MTRFLALFLLGFGALAEERPNPAILKWQAEAQARERTINRRAEDQFEKRAAQEAAKEKKPAPSTITPEAQSSIIDTSRR